MSEEMKLLPCPFCGSPAMRDDDDEMEAKFEGAACSKEGCILHKFFIEDYEWNRRAPAHADEPVAIPKDFVTSRGVSAKAFIYKEDLTHTHAPWRIVLPNGATLTLGYHDDDAVDKAHAEFIANAINQALYARPSAGIRSEVIEEPTKIEIPAETVVNALGLSISNGLPFKLTVSFDPPLPASVGPFINSRTLGES